MFRVLIFLSFFLLLSTTLFARERITDEKETRAVFDEVDERRNSIQTEWAELEMVITNSRGQTRTRIMQSWTRNQDENTDNLIIFTEPGNVRGTGFLSVDETGSETQRLYLPSIGRIQVISAAEQGDPFMGSDFTYEDLGDQDPDDMNLNGSKPEKYFIVLWSPRKMTMFDLREDRKTELLWQEREINTEIPDWRFTVRGFRQM